MMEYFWAFDTHPYHMKCDEEKISEHEDVDIIPAWSLGKMIEGFPSNITYCEKPEEEDYLDYDLHLCPEGDYLTEVKYVLFEGTKILYRTEALNLLDAVFEMIMKLKSLGWYDCPSEESNS